MRTETALHNKVDAPSEKRLKFVHNRKVVVKPPVLREIDQ